MTPQALQIAALVLILAILLWAGYRAVQTHSAKAHPPPRHKNQGPGPDVGDPPDF